MKNYFRKYASFILSSFVVLLGVFSLTFFLLRGDDTEKRKADVGSILLTDKGNIGPLFEGDPIVPRSDGTNSKGLGTNAGTTTTGFAVEGTSGTGRATFETYDQGLTKEEYLALVDPKQSSGSTPDNSGPVTVAPTKYAVFTEEDMFRFLNPPQFLDAVYALQDGLVTLGHMTESERVVFNTEEKVAAFFALFMERAYSANGAPEGQTDEDFFRVKAYIEGDYAEFKRAEAEQIWNLPFNQQADLKRRREESNIWISTQIVSQLYKIGTPLVRELGVAEAIKTAFRIWTAKDAYAQGDCYKDNAPQSQILGYNSIAPCCNCYVVCGKALCPIGCLNYVCQYWPNAIWDPTTGICGCG